MGSFEASSYDRLCRLLHFCVVCLLGQSQQHEIICGWALPAGGLPCGSDCSYGRLVANWWLYIGGARNCYQCQCWLHMFLIRALCNPHGQLSWLLLGSEFWCSYPNDHRWRWMSRKRTMIITTMIGQVCVGVGKCNVSFEGIAFGREGARQHWTQSYYMIYFVYILTAESWFAVFYSAFMVGYWLWVEYFGIQRNDYSYFVGFPVFNLVRIENNCQANCLL